MKNRIKQLGKHSVIFGFGESLKRFVGFLLIPIYTRYLTPVDYGQLELLVLTSAILYIIVSQGIGTAFFRSYVFVEKELKSSVNNLISTAYYYIFCSALVVSLLLFVFSKQYNIFLFGDNKATELYIKIIAITLLLSVIQLIPFQVLRARKEPIKFITVSLIGFLVQVSLNILFVTVFRLGIKGILIANAIAGCFTAVITFLIVKKYLTFKLSTIILKDLIWFGLPLILSSLSFHIMQMSDRFLLQKLSSTHEVGLYSIGLRFANILNIMLISPFRIAWGPFSFETAAKTEAKATFRKITNYFFLILCFFGMMVIVWSPSVIKIVTGAQFWDADQVILPLVYANICNGMLLIFVFGLYLVKKTKIIALIVTIGAVVNIGLNILVIPKYGMLGAAFVSLFSFVVINLLFYIFSQKYYFIPFDKARLLTILFISIVTSCLSLYQAPNYLMDNLFRLSLMVLFGISLYVFKVFEASEISYVKRSFAELRKNKGIINKVRYAYNNFKN
ncbi:MAG: polysaccharide biosynthesis C-terminal domain-containing protein [Desulfobacteraceae bacterium]